MRTAFLVVSLTLFAVSAAAQDIPAPTGAKIVSPDARLELLFTRSAPIAGGLTEGPAVAPDGSIYFTDIPFGKYGGMILRFDPASGQTATFSLDSGKANGLVFDAQGNLLACEGGDYGGRRVSRYNIRTGERTTVVDTIQGKKFNAPNDLCLDAKGRIYFTDPRYVGLESRELKHRAVYRIDADGSVYELTHQVTKPNGIGISPDGKTLYVADHDNGTDNIDPTAPPPKQGVMKIYAFPLASNGTVGKRRTIVDFGEEKGCDGMSIDEHGNIYLTVRGNRRPGVLVIDPQGKQVAHIPTGPANQKPTSDRPPVGLPSNVEFGRGAGANDLYITVDKSLYRIRLKVKGHFVQYSD
jgi:gluconolactonase